MKYTFTYPLFFKLIYKYGNIPVTIILLFYLIPISQNLDRGWLYIIPFVLILLLLYIINKHYLKLYKILPYRIEADENKIVCSDFMFSKEEVIINFVDIAQLRGGIFEGRYSGLMKIYDGKHFIWVGFYNRLKNMNLLLTLILSKVPKELYNEVIEKIGLKKK